MPATEHDVIYSMAFSDHYFDAVTLNDIAQSVKAGQRPSVSKQQEDMLRPAAREYLETHSAMIARGNKHIRSPSEAAPRDAPPDSVPFHPDLPAVGGGEPVRLFKSEHYTVLFDSNVKTLAADTAGSTTTRYRYVATALDMRSKEPVHFIVLENRSLGVPATLCAFDRRGRHHNYGHDPSLEGETEFVRKALELMEAELGVQLTEQSASPQGEPDLAHDDGSDPNRAYKVHLLGMLDQMRKEFTQADLQNPTTRRLYKFTEDFAAFLLGGNTTDAESDRLGREIDWMRTTKISLPAAVGDTMKDILRTEAPRTKARIERLMETHFAYMSSGTGNRKNIEREIDSLRADGLLSKADGASLKRTLDSGDTGASDRLRRLAAGEDPSSVYGRKSWWRALFGL